jgi:microcompartment protein CcmK/EutM
VATRKDPRLQAHTLLVVKPVTPDGRDEPGYQVAVDTVGAGTGQLVFTVGGSSARMAYGCQDKPVDCVIVGIVDGLAMDESKAGR